MSESSRRSIGERLREAREYIGFSQEEVAQHLQLSRSAISQIEHGRRKVDTLELKRLAALYQRSVASLVGEEKRAAASAPQVEIVARATAELSEEDRDEVLRFVEYLQARSSSKSKKNE